MDSLVFLGIVDYSSFGEASFFQLPAFKFIGTYKLNFSAIAMFAPLAFVTIAEHIGDHNLLSEVMGKDLITDPGLHRTLLGDGVATLFAGAIGGPANTSYGENIGVVTMTGVTTAWVTGIAAGYGDPSWFFRISSSVYYEHSLGCYWRNDNSIIRINRFKWC